MSVSFDVLSSTFASRKCYATLGLAKYLKTFCVLCGSIYKENNRCSIINEWLFVYCFGLARLETSHILEGNEN